MSSITGDGRGRAGTAPIVDALNTVGRPAPDEWIGRLGALPLVEQPGGPWTYDTAADVTGVLLAPRHRPVARGRPA